MTAGYYYRNSFCHIRYPYKQRTGLKPTKSKSITEMISAIIGFNDEDKFAVLRNTSYNK